MKVPAIFYGEYKTVLRDVKALAQAFIHHEAVGGLVHATLPSEAVTGLFVLDEPHPRLKPGLHFFTGALARCLLVLYGKRRYESAVWDRVYDWAVSAPGYFLTVLGQEASVAHLHASPRHQISFGRAGVRYWPDLSGAGARYVARNGVPTELWSVPNGIKRSMIMLSGRSDWVGQPLPSGGLEQVVQALNLPLEKCEGEA